MCNLAVGIEHFPPTNVSMYSHAHITLHFLGNLLPDVLSIPKYKTNAFFCNPLPGSQSIPKYKTKNASYLDKLLACDIRVQLCVCKSNGTCTLR